MEWRLVDLMVNVLVSGSSGLDSSPDPGRVLGQHKAYEFNNVKCVFSEVILVLSSFSQGQSSAALSAEKLRYCLSCMHSTC